MEREFNLRPEFRDPSRFPCAVVTCSTSASGWVLPFHLRPEWGVRMDMERAYLCKEHLQEALPGWQPTPDEHSGGTAHGSA